MNIHRSQMLVSLRRSFTAGLLVLVPLLLTIWIVDRLFRAISGVLDGPVTLLLGGPLQLEMPLPLLGWAGVKTGHLVPVLSILSLIIIILILGVIARNVFGARALRYGEHLLNQIPIIRRIYQAVRQISEVFLSEKKTAFKRAVMFEYPRKRVWSVGFVTLESPSEVTCNLPDSNCYHIFLPTSPNPTSGYMLIIPKKDCIDLDMPVEDALKLVISGGSVSPIKHATTT